MNGLVVCVLRGVYGSTSHPSSLVTLDALLLVVSTANILQCIKGELGVKVLADNVGNE
ncbi:hypothetical protein GcM3_168014 [Golovinomyces cichoracearum]|uniref:Uncharacterized protein n=1 Tax=Golovinomyces cichoracearum TaxID=62708 RepID=A0A420HRN1_9PEZI|nr:hypothetical protein GcM3_168014 [Golovinomyces cichoracearum]